MTTADLLALVQRADRKLTYEQFRTWVVAQSVRNALQTFHGSWAFDPDNPGSWEGFISDGQMRALNITIRRAVHEALGQVDMARNVVTQPQHGEPRAGEQMALDFCQFQLGTVHDYMEPPGSPELEEAYQRYVGEPDVNR
jgi:phage baseplate assembly protein W